MRYSTHYMLHHERMAQWCNAKHVSPRCRDALITAACRSSDSASRYHRGYAAAISNRLRSNMSYSSACRGNTAQRFEKMSKLCEYKFPRCAQVALSSLRILLCSFLTAPINVITYEPSHFNPLSLAKSNTARRKWSKVHLHGEDSVFEGSIHIKCRQGIHFSHILRVQEL